MTRHIDHAPQYPNNPNDRRYHQGSDGRLQDTQNPVHSERFADPYGGSAPAHPDGPRGELKRPKDSKTVLKVVGAIGAASLAAGAAFGIYNYSKFKDLTEDIRDGADRTVSAPYNPGETDGSIDYSKIDIATYPSEAFSELPYSVRLDKCAPYVDGKIKEGAEQKFNEANRAINGEGLAPGGIGSGKITDTRQQKINRHLVKLDIFRTETNQTLARNALWCATPTQALRDAYLNTILGRDKRVIGPSYANNESAIFTIGSFANTEAGGKPTQVVGGGGEATDGKIVNYVFQEEQGTQSSEVVVTEILTSASPYWVRNTSGIHP